MYAARTTSNSRRLATSCILQHSCTLLNLPRELRDEIYSLLLPSHTTLKFTGPTWANSAAGRFFDIQYDTSQCSLTILELCQQIRAEANAVLYNTNRFEFLIGGLVNTVRALPQSGISQIRACTIHIAVFLKIRDDKLSLICGWVDELCKLLKKGGNLQEIHVEMQVSPHLYVHFASPRDLARFESLLEPLEGLKCLKSGDVKGVVTEDYRAEFRKRIEGGGTRKSKKREAETDTSEETRILRPKRRCAK